MSINTYTINGVEINGSRYIPPVVNKVSFNGFDLSNCDSIVILQGMNEKDLASIVTEKFFAPRVDGGGIYAHNVQDRLLEFNVLIQKDTQLAYEQTLDEIKEAITTTQGDFIIEIAGEFRKARANVQKFEEVERTKGQLNRGEFEVAFLIMEDWTSVQPTSITHTTSDANFNFDINNKGSKATYPSIYISVLTGSITNMTIDHNGYTYTIPVTANAGDNITLFGDHPNIKKQQNAFLNSNLILTSGRYPYIDKGNTNILDFNITGTYTAQFYLIYYNKRY